MDIGIPGGHDPDEIAKAIIEKYPSDAVNAVQYLSR